MKQTYAICGYCMIRYVPLFDGGIYMTACPKCRATDSQELIKDNGD